jgi:hypothetical protein
MFDTINRTVSDTEPGPRRAVKRFRRRRVDVPGLMRTGSGLKSEKP